MDIIVFVLGGSLKCCKRNLRCKNMTTQYNRHDQAPSSMHNPAGLVMVDATTTQSDGQRGAPIIRNTIRRLVANQSPIPRLKLSFSVSEAHELFSSQLRHPRDRTLCQGFPSSVDIGGERAVAHSHGARGSFPRYRSLANGRQLGRVASAGSCKVGCGGVRLCGGGCRAKYNEGTARE